MNKGSLLSIVKGYFGYVVNDPSKTHQEKVIDILGATARFTHTATQTGDEATLDYLLNEAYLKEFALALPPPQTSQTSDSTLGNKGVTPSDRDAISLLPDVGGRSGNGAGNNDVEDNHDIGEASVLEEDPDLETLIEGDGEEVSGLSLLDRGVYSEDTEHTEVSDPINNKSLFFETYQVNPDKSYSVTDTLAILFPCTAKLKQKDREFANLYQRVIKSDYFEHLVKVEPHGKYRFYFVKGKDMPELLRIILKRAPDWRRKLPESLKDINVESLEGRVGNSGNWSPSVDEDGAPVGDQLDFFTKYKVNRDQEYRLVEVLEQLFPGGRHGDFGNGGAFPRLYQRVLMNKEVMTLVHSYKKGDKKLYFVKGANVPLMYRLVIESEFIEWKDKLPTHFLDDVLNYDLSKVPRKVEMFMGRFEVSPDSQYKLVDVLEVLCPSGANSREGRFTQLYQSVAFSVSFKDLITEEKNGTGGGVYYVKGNNVQSLLNAILTRGLSWKAELSQELLDTINGNGNSSAVVTLPPREDYVPKRVGAINDDDVVTAEDLAKVMGVSRGKIKEMGINFKGAGTTIYTNVREVKHLLSESQMRMLNGVVS